MDDQAKTQQKFQLEPIAVVLQFIIIFLLLSLGCQTRKATLNAAKLKPSLGLPFVSRTTAISLKSLGQQKAIVFSPDIAASGNKVFYQGVGFLYLESSNWYTVLRSIIDYNGLHQTEPIREIFLETHGCNGNGLKLQQSSNPAAPRSYISLGGLQERLANCGVEWIVLTACNSGRLFRPKIYCTLDLTLKDSTLLPATLGVINASADFEPGCSTIKYVRRSVSRIEQTSDGLFAELAPAVRDRIGLQEQTTTFVVSNLFMQILLGDEHLHLTDAGYTDVLSDETEDEATNEAIFQRFLGQLHDLAGDELKVEGKQK